MFLNQLIIFCHILFIILLPAVHSLSAYDCRGEGTSYTVMSANSVGECKYPKLTTSNKQSDHITVVQKLKYQSVSITTCKVDIQQTIMHCGMHSHNSVSLNGFETFSYELSPNACTDIIQRGIWEYPYKPEIRIKVSAGKSTSQTIYVVGNVARNGACTSGSFAYKGIQYEEVFVSHFISISVIARDGRVDMDEDHISVEGIRCKHSVGSCFDEELGMSVWSLVKRDECSPDSYSLLYSGTADITMLQENDLQNSYTIVTVQQDKQLFSLRLVKRQEKCYTDFWITDQDNIFVILSKAAIAFPKALEQDLKLNIQLSSYINTKLVYLEGHIQGQMEQLYQSLLYQQCKTRKSLLQLMLSQVSSIPEDFAMVLMNSPGYTSLLEGELVYLIRCKEVSVQRRENHGVCYTDIPVDYKNESMFMSARTRILKSYSSEVECHPIYRNGFNFSGNWFSISKHDFTPISIPLQIDPNPNISWSFHTTPWLGASGLYSKEQLAALNKAFLFPAERSSILNTLSNRIMSDNEITQNIPYYRILDESYLQGKITSTWKKMTGWLESFGLWTATWIGVITIVKLMIFAVNSSINVYALYQSFGFSFQIIAGFFTSLTHLILLSKMKKTSNPSAPADQEPALVEENVPLQDTNPPMNQQKYLYPRLV